MYTEHGRKIRANLGNLFSLDRIAKAVEPIVLTVPQSVVKRTKDNKSGGEQNKRYSAYSDSIIPRGEYKGMTWIEVRKQKGLQTTAKDFWFSGTMWNSYKMVKKKIGDNGVSFTFATTDGTLRGGKGSLSDFHSEKEGVNLLSLTEDEFYKLSEEIWNALIKEVKI